MCASCGCLRGDDDHGERDHITVETLERAARAAGITVEEVVNNIRDTWDVANGILRLGAAPSPIRVSDEVVAASRQVLAAPPRAG